MHWREREHGILWVIRAERSFGQRVKAMKYCLKGGRETVRENHQTAFFLTLPPGEGRSEKRTALGHEIRDYVSETHQNNPIKMGTWL